MPDTKSSVYLKDVLSQVFYVQVDAKTNKLRQVTVPVSFRIGINPCDAALTVTGPIFSKCPGSTSVFEGNLIVCGSISATEVDAPNLTGSAASILQWTVGPNTLSTTSSVNINGGNGLYAEGVITADGGLSGSLTQLHTGLSYLVQGAGILITSASNGSVTVASTAGATPLQWTVGTDNLSTTSSVNIHDFLYVSGPVTSSLGFSGSLTRLHNGLSYIAAGLNISVISESNGSINIHGIPRQWAVGDGTLTTTASVETTGYLYAQSSITSDAGLSGSLTRLHTGLSYLVQGENIAITSESNGSVTITNSYVPAPTILQWTVAADNLSTTSSVNIHDFLYVSGPITSSYGFSGSLTRLNTGLSYLVQGNGILITSASNGSVTITNSAPDSALQWTVGPNTLSTTSSVNINGGNGLYAEGVITADGGLSGSLTKLADGTSYLIQGAGISITSASNGSVTITNSAIPAPLQWTVGTNTLSTTSSVYVNNSLFALGPMTSSLGLSGSLTRLHTGLSYLVQGAGISITSASNGSVTITSSASGTLQWTVGAGTLSTTSSVNIYGGNGLYTEGAIISDGGISGSLTKLHTGDSYLVQGTGISITSASNGSVTITNTAAGETLTPNIQTFTSGSGTWTKPTDRTYQMALIEVWGAGGGGAGGGTGASGARNGGSGGGGGCYQRLVVTIDELSSTENYVVGVSGSSGAAAGDGGTGGLSSFGTTIMVAAGGGGGGRRGTSTGIAGQGGGGGGVGENGELGGTTSALSGNGGGPGATRTNDDDGLLSTQGAKGGDGSYLGDPGGTAEWGGGGGAGRTATGGTADAGSSYWGAGGGGQGGSSDAASAALPPSAGGSTRARDAGGGGAAGTSGNTGTVGTAGTAGTGSRSGTGGGGGGSSVGAGVTGAAGGDGGARGGGGGGGGSGDSAGVGGIGGRGGRGEVRITCW